MKLVIGTSIFTPFACDYENCKGGCCNEESTCSLEGCPLTDDEVKEIQLASKDIAPFIPTKERRRINKENPVYFFDGHPRVRMDSKGVCIYSGRGRCVLIDAHLDKLLSFKVPKSCGMYPIIEDATEDSVQLTLDDTLFPACKYGVLKGARDNMPAFKFLKEGIISRFNNEIYELIENAHTDFINGDIIPDNGNITIDISDI